MNKDKKKEACPTCGQPMHFLDSKKPSIEFIKSGKIEGIDKKPFAFLETWNCLNCDEEWEFNIKKGGWKLK